MAYPLSFGQLVHVGLQVVDGWAQLEYLPHHRVEGEMLVHSCTHHLKKKSHEIKNADWRPYSRKYERQ